MKEEAPGKAEGLCQGRRIAMEPKEPWLISVYLIGKGLSIGETLIFEVEKPDIGVRDWWRKRKWQSFLPLPSIAFFDVLSALGGHVIRYFRFTQ